MRRTVNRCSEGNHGRLVIRYVLRAFQAAGIGHLGTPSLRHSFRAWLHVVGTPMAVQQKLMRHADIRTTMNTYGDTFQPELADAVSKVAGLVLNGALTERKPSYVFCFGGSVRELNPLAVVLPNPYGG